MRRVLAVLLSLAFLLPTLTAPVAAAEGRLFPGTGKTVQGDFLAFYDANGGEDIFGVPLTDEQVEGGRTVQYFSRARFELWPENPPAYRVQLGLLGTLLGGAQPPMTGDIPADDAQHRYFPQTGQILAYAFKDFWESHGGLDIFGYPISGEYLSNGVVVQYFQRARMEWHPENAPGSQVVLGNLGAEYLHVAVPTATAASAPAAAPAPSAATVAASASGRLLFQTSSGGDIYVVNPDGSGLHLVGHGVDPSWSPDGTKIVYARWDYPWGVYIADADGQNAHQVAMTSYPWETKEAQSPTLSPDGRFVAFYEKYKDWRPVFDLGQRRSVLQLVDLWRMLIVNLQTGQVHDITEQDFASSPTWAPSAQTPGGVLAFASRQGLYFLNQVESNRQITQVPGTDPLFISPAWSPDGKTLAFQWKQHDHFEIGTMRTDGSGFQLLTSSPPFTTPANNVSPAWSPDGSKIAFVSDRNGSWQLFTMNADGSNQQVVNLGGVQLNYAFARERMVSWGK